MTRENSLASKVFTHAHSRERTLISSKGGAEDKVRAEAARERLHLLKYCCDFLKCLDAAGVQLHRNYSFGCLLIAHVDKSGLLYFRSSFRSRRTGSHGGNHLQCHERAKDHRQVSEIGMSVNRYLHPLSSYNA